MLFRSRRSRAAGRGLARLKFLVAGLVNTETTVRVQGFPLEYAPVHYPFFGIQSAASGVGFNVASALVTLGATVNLCAFIGEDSAGSVVRARLEALGLAGYLEPIPEHPQSVALVDSSGQRSIYTDLKDVQDRQFDPEMLAAALRDADAALIGNLNFARPALALARAADVPIYTDLHAIHHLDNPYDRDFLEAADVLFFSGEYLPAEPIELALEGFNRHAQLQVIVIGAGARGAWLFERGERPHLEPGIPNPALKSTIGAGDALCASFAYVHRQSGDARFAIARAVRFASHKLGSIGGASGFLTATELERLM